VNQIYHKLKQVIGVEPEIVRASKRPGDIHLITFDRSKAEQGLGWIPTTSFEEGIQRTVAFFKARAAGDHEERDWSSSANKDTK
jgi:nucleoside-diphosphate-sugar epimerase